MATAEGVRVKAQPLPKPPLGSEINRSLYMLCYYYPQYTLQEARQLPFNHVMALLQTARREKALEYSELLNISTAPHTKKGQGVKKLANQYKEIARG